MKKILSVLLIAALCMGLVTLTGCGEKAIENPFEKYNLEDYVTLPDYDSYTTEKPEITITDEDIEERIEEILQENATSKEVTSGKVEKGDTVTISYKGTLEDGSTEDGMNSDAYTLTLGQANMIDGFQEAIYGATIGKPVTANLEFPDPYEVNEKLAGKPVTFVITVKSKTVSVPAELNDEFVKKNSDVKTVEEYKKVIAKELEESEYKKETGSLKTDIYKKITEEAKISEAIPEVVDAEFDALDKKYRAAAEANGIEWADFLKDSLNFTEEEYKETMKEYCEDMVRTQMIIYAMAEKEDVELTEKEYEDIVAEMLEQSGYKDKTEFEAAIGMTFDEYAEMSSLKLNLLLDEVLEKIYTRLVEKA